MTAASEHGTFRLTYTPPEATGHEDYPLIAIEMSTNGDANVDQMLRFYEAFLAASGFILKGDLQVIERAPEPGQWYNTIGTEFNPIDFPGFTFNSDDVITFGDK